MSPAKHFFFARIFPLIFIVVGAGVLFFGTRSLFRAKESVSWPVAEGRIQSSGVEYVDCKHGGKGSFIAQIQYSFTVNGEPHSGNKVAFGDYGASESHAQSIVNRYPKGMRVTVRFLATDPNVCVLEPGIQGQAWLLPGAGLFFTVSGLFLAVQMPKTKMK
jgi:hypothetical protein